MEALGGFDKTNRNEQTTPKNLRTRTPRQKSAPSSNDIPWIFSPPEKRERENITPSGLLAVSKKSNKFAEKSVLY